MNMTINKAQILIVDDEPTNIQLLAACLKSQYHIRVAKNGEQCLGLTGVKPQPDLVLLDVGMPGLDGYEVCKRLKEDISTKDIPIIFVTGNDDVREEEYGLQIGAVDYITKPIRPAVVAARVNTHILLKQNRDKLELLALRDQLTQLYNRHYLFEVARQKIAQSLRHQYKFSLLMIDIDHFKEINDTHGHLCGDNILKSVANILVDNIRSEDIAARFGGEEFVMLLDRCNSEAAVEKGNRLRMDIETSKPQGIKITVSIGVAQLVSDDSSFSSLLNRADQALYLAKERGRNCIVNAASHN